MRTAPSRAVSSCTRECLPSPCSMRGEQPCLILRLASLKEHCSCPAGCLQQDWAHGMLSSLSNNWIKSRADKRRNLPRRLPAGTRQERLGMASCETLDTWRLCAACLRGCLQELGSRLLRTAPSDMLHKWHLCAACLIGCLQPICSSRVGYDDMPCHDPWTGKHQTSQAAAPHNSYLLN